MKNIRLKIFRIFLMLFSFLLIIFLICQDLALSGKIEFQSDFKKFTSAISVLVPEERVDSSEKNIIRQEPVYFDLYLPRDFEKAIFQFEFDNKDAELIEVGAQTENSQWELKPLNLENLNNLNWTQIHSANSILWQKEEKYKSIEEFLANLPEINKIAVYNYDLDYDYKLSNYQAKNYLTVIEPQIAGNYQVLTYIKDETLDFLFEFQADNQVIGLAKIFNSQGQEFLRLNILGDSLQIDMPELSEGVYKIVLELPDEVITSKITSLQRKICFINQLNIIKESQLITEAKELVFFAKDPQGLQTVLVENQPLEINEIWKQVKASLNPGFKTINIPKGNLTVIGNAIFAFEPEQYFNPRLINVSPLTNFEKEGIEYIIADYSLPLNQDGFKMNNVEFDLAGKQIENGKLRFIISAPGLSLEKQGIKIKNIKVKLQRQSFLEQGVIDNILDYLRFYKNEIN